MGQLQSMRAEETGRGDRKGNDGGVHVDLSGWEVNRWQMEEV